ncbi:YbaN family protein [uncultured Sphingomonas sp.]|uniref:YbaN family protein n=1 Tax=uncultured Sphingomonas sp. TaxID=158754 RepID=UPI0025FAE858|nr:YbaN family protein [uncultured Sphingomonas sp.]
MRLFYLAAGFLALALGVIGIFLPLMPTVPFMLLAAFFFARSNPEWEAKLLADPRFGPHIRAWRERGAISRLGKTAGIVGLCGSAIMGLVFLYAPWRYVPLAVALLCGSWIATRPTA